MKPSLISSIFLTVISIGCKTASTRFILPTNSDHIDIASHNITQFAFEQTVVLKKNSEIFFSEMLAEAQRKSGITATISNVRYMMPNGTSNIDYHEVMFDVYIPVNSHKISRSNEGVSDTIVQIGTSRLPTNNNGIPEYAKEFLFSKPTEKALIYSHNSLERQVNGGVNGPMKYSDLKELMGSHPDFKSAFIPDIEDLKKLSDSDTKLRFLLMRNSLVVWSSTINPNGNVQCLNFRTGEIVEKNPDSSSHFVPIVKVLSK